MKRQIVRTDRLGKAASDARKTAAFALVAVIVTLAIFYITRHAAP